jgi:hypothetical protein
MNEYMEVAAIELNDRKVYIVSDWHDVSIGMYYDSRFFYGEDVIEKINKLFCYMLVTYNKEFVEELLDDILQGLYLTFSHYTHYQWKVDKLEVRENDNKTLSIKIYNNGSKKFKPSVREFIYSGSYSIEMITDSIELITESDNV